MNSFIKFVREQEILTYKVKHYGKCTLKLYSSSSDSFLMIERTIKGALIRNVLKVQTFLVPENFWYDIQQKCWEYRKTIKALGEVK